MSLCSSPLHSEGKLLEGGTVRLTVVPQGWAKAWNTGHPVPICSSASFLWPAPSASRPGGALPPSGSTLPSLLCQLSQVPALDSVTSCGSPWQLLHSSALTVSFAKMQTRPITDAQSDFTRTSTQPGHPSAPPPVPADLVALPPSLRLGVVLTCSTLETTEASQPLQLSPSIPDGALVSPLCRDPTPHFLGGPVLEGSLKTLAFFSFFPCAASSLSPLNTLKLPVLRQHL